MTTSIALVVAVGALFAAGVTLLLERSLTRVLLGFVLMGNGANLLILTAAGPAGRPPILGGSGRMSDPLPQAMALTAIVITLGVVAFLLALAHRSWELDGHDDVQDDVEDARVARRLEQAAEGDDVEAGADADEEAEREAARDASEVRELPAERL